MDQSSEIKPANVVDRLNSGIAVLDNLPEVKITAEVNLSVCDYSGDTELECLKKELVDFDVKELNNLVTSESASNSKTDPNEDLKMDDQIENSDIVSVDNESSSGVDSNSDSSRDFSNVSAHSFLENGVKMQHAHSVDKPIQLITEANNAGKVTFDGTLKSEDLKVKDEFSGNVNSENNLEDLTKNTGTLSSTVNSVLDQEFTSETKSACIVANSKLNETATLPMTAFRGKIKLRESNPYEFVVPFIGKKIDLGDDDQPLPFNADIAKAINKQKFEENARYLSKMTFHEYRKKRQARTKEEIEMEDQRDQLIAFRVARYVLKNLAKILLQMQKDEPDETAMIKYFIRFLKVPVTPLAMIHIPQFVHTVMYIRGCPKFSLYVRRIAQRCFEKIHVLFPIPAGYNFETVYTNEVQKCLPEGFHGMYDYLMVYDDMDSTSEGEDSAFSDDNGDIDK